GDRGLAPQQAPPLAHPAAARRDRRSGGRADQPSAAARGDPLERAGNGQDGGDQSVLGAAHLGGTRASTASGALVQDLQRPRIRRHVDPPPMPWSSASTRKAKSKRSTAPSLACR